MSSEPKRIKSAYEVIKRTQIKGALPPGEQQELEDLEARKRRSAAQEARVDELWSKAFRDHVPPQPAPGFTNDW